MAAQHGSAGKLIVHSDGAARGNPGPAGAGARVVDSEGRCLAELRKSLGSTTNNVAEYEGAILGLTEALALGGREVELRADSELMIRQLEGRYRVKAPHLVPLFEEARTLLGRFERARVVHVPRERNRDADRLANEAIDGTAPGPVNESGLEPGARALLEEALRLPATQRRALATKLKESLG